jgi:hypothetical protein
MISPRAISLPYLIPTRVGDLNCDYHRKHLTRAFPQPRDY